MLDSFVEDELFEALRELGVFFLCCVCLAGMQAERASKERRLRAKKLTFFIINLFPFADGE